MVADVEIIPACDWLHFVACVVAREEASGVRSVAANANPGFLVTFFVCDEFLGHFCNLVKKIFRLKTCPFIASKAAAILRNQRLD